MFFERQLALQNLQYGVFHVLLLFANCGLHIVHSIKIHKKLKYMCMYGCMSIYTYGVCTCTFSPGDHSKLVYLCTYMCLYIHMVCMCSCTFPPRDHSKLTHVYMCYVSTYACVCIQVLNIHQHTLTTAQRHSQHSLKFSFISLMLYLLFPSSLLPVLHSLILFLQNSPQVLPSSLLTLSSSGVPSSCCNECLMGSLLFWLSWLALSHLLL